MSEEITITLPADASHDDVVAAWNEAHIKHRAEEKLSVTLPRRLVHMYANPCGAAIGSPRWELASYLSAAEHKHTHRADQRGDWVPKVGDKAWARVVVERPTDPDGDVLVSFTASIGHFKKYMATDQLRKRCDHE